MKIYKLSKGILNTDYKGCGPALAAIDGRGEVVALKYLENEISEQSVKERREAAAQLALLGDVYEGMASCCEFCVG